ncbi:fungal-specific transcription factor domain-containing protein [Hypoxylon sp. FL1857]|nr:fungal-specific transcription factor domain-containing protein [Hypoxylon sp. FL1857]
MASGCRQLPGLSCEECRRRKARCDRVRPQCGTCAETGITCIVVDKRPQRGPKKGQLKALRSRVGEFLFPVGFCSLEDHTLNTRAGGIILTINTSTATLERQLTSQLGSFETHVIEIDPDATVSGPCVFDDVEQDMNVNMDINISDAAESEKKKHPETPRFTSMTPILTPIATEWQDNDLVSPENVTLSKPPDLSPTNLLEGLGISDLMWADLDLLYFDRVHSVLPIMHKQRHFAWAGREVLTPAQVSLRLAMRTVAAAVSTQFRGLSDALYIETRRILETPDMSEQSLPWMPGNIPLEKIQAWLLVAHYEFLCMYEQQAMITAGHAFRLVQLSRLYDVDMVDVPAVEFTAAIPSTPSPTPDESFAEVEERRRTFWLAFCFDRFLNTRNEWPLTLHEEMICTRLPAPETNFQNSSPIRMDFLPEALTNSGRSTHSPFAECIILATLYGRCMAHRRLSLASSLSGNEPHEFWTRHEWLSAVLDKRTQVLVQASATTSTLDDHDPMLSFSHMLARSAIIYLSITTEIKPWQSVKHQMTASTYEERAYQAARDMAHLVAAMPRLSCFKAHPFLPNALSDAAAFLMAHAKTPDLANPNTEEEDCVERLLGALRNLRDVNNLARDLLQKLEADNLRITSGVPCTTLTEHSDRCNT